MTAIHTIIPSSSRLSHHLATWATSRPSSLVTVVSISVVPIARLACRRSSMLNTLWLRDWACNLLYRAAHSSFDTVSHSSLPAGRGT
ncbi:hypothetical protein LX36DRAFT_487655 [Colletotrichum falcatum]|nr:hypothetical protein LX36DRAFT_487655 [Colletotrichum falcatum]